MQEDRTIYSTPFKDDPGFIFHDSFMLNFLRIWEHRGAEEACKYIRHLAYMGWAAINQTKTIPFGCMV